MPNPLLLDLVLFLQNQGLVQEDGVDAFRDYEPAEPDDAFILHEYQGAPIPTFEKELLHRSIQISYRSLEVDVASQKAWELFRVFKTDDEASRIDFTEERWGQVYLRQPPFKLKQDAAGRIYYGFNMGITTLTE